MSEMNLNESGYDKQRIVGKFFQEMDETETVVIWKIPNFTKKLPEPPSTRYISAIFAFSDTFWHLSIYPNGDNREESKGYTGLYLLLKGRHGCEISYTMSIMNTKGVEEFSLKATHQFDNSKNSTGKIRFCEKSTLMNRKSELLPADILTVQIRMKKDNSSLIGGVCQIERLLNLQNDLKKILTEKETCDLVLKLQGQEIKAHKLILENRCKYFQSMLSHDMVERKTGAISIDDIEPDVFREVLAYIYCGEVQNLSTDNMRELYMAADKYQLDELKKLCAVFIAENLSVYLFCEILSIPETCIEAELMLRLKEFFSHNFESIVVTEKWKNFQKENKDLSYELVLSTLMAR